MSRGALNPRPERMVRARASMSARRVGSSWDWRSRRMSVADVVSSLIVSGAIEESGCERLFSEFI